MRSVTLGLATALLGITVLALPKYAFIFGSLALGGQCLTTFSVIQLSNSRWFGECQLQFCPSITEFEQPNLRIRTFECTWQWLVKFSFSLSSVVLPFLIPFLYLLSQNHLPWVILQARLSYMQFDRNSTIPPPPSIWCLVSASHSSVLRMLSFAQLAATIQPWTGKSRGLGIPLSELSSAFSHHSPSMISPLRSESTSIKRWCSQVAITFYHSLTSIIITVSSSWWYWQSLAFGWLVHLFNNFTTLFNDCYDFVRPPTQKSIR